MNVADILADYRQRLTVAYGELKAARAVLLPYCETPATDDETRRAIAQVARATKTVADVLIRIIDSLPQK